MDVLTKPAPTFGLATASITMSAVWASTTNSSLAGTVVTGATFQVQLAGTTWTPVCPDEAGNCNGTCSGAFCTYSYPLPSLLSAQYSLQLRAVLNGVTGDATSVAWSFLRCSTSQFALVNDTDGAVECADCKRRKDWGVPTLAIKHTLRHSLTHSLPPSLTHSLSALERHSYELMAVVRVDDVCL